MEHFQSPRNRGRLERYDLLGTAGVLGQGPFVAIYLRLAAGQVEKAGFECNACGVTVAVCSAVTALVEGRTLAECRTLGETDVREALDGVPADKLDRVRFVLLALRNLVESGDS